MVDDYATEKLIKRYAEENYFTLVSNSPGSLEYVKYINNDMKKIMLLKWPKGSDTVIISSANGDVERLELKNLFGE